MEAEKGSCETKLEGISFPVDRGGMSARSRGEYTGDGAGPRAELPVTSWKVTH